MTNGADRRVGANNPHTELRDRIARVSRCIQWHPISGPCVEECRRPSSWNYELADAVIETLGLRRVNRYAERRQFHCYVTDWTADE